MINPIPIVAIDGADVASGPGPGPLIVVDGLTVTWGRTDPLDQPEPATGSLTLFDSSSTWGTGLDLRGRRVTLSWQADEPGAGTVRRVFFRGRIAAPVKVSRKTVTMPDGRTVTGSLLELPLVSVLVDLANRTPTGAWPEETLGARADRIAALAADVLPGGVVVRQFWREPNVAPVAADRQRSLLDQLVELYDSTHNRMTYQPHEQRLTYLDRRDYWTARTLGALTWDVPGAGTARAGRGVYAHSVTGTYLDGGHLEYDPADGVVQPERITQVRLTHPEASNGFAQRTVTVPVQDTDVRRHGLRTLTVQSQVAWNAWADLLASDYEDMARKEGAAWRTEPLRLRTARTGGFEEWAQVTALLAGTENRDLWFAQGSWLPVFGLRPVFGIMGATVTYADGGWDLDLHAAAVTTRLRQHQISWDEFDDGSAGFEVRWYDGDHSRGLHESLTYEDLGWVGSGVRADVSPGPDSGWDVQAP